MHQTGSLSNIVALIAFTALTVALALLQPVTGFPQAEAADMGLTRPHVTPAITTSATTTARPSRDQTDAIRAACGNAHVQYEKLAGYRQCLDQQHIRYEASAWCPVVKTFCDAQWFPFGDRERCFSERGCPAS